MSAARNAGDTPRTAMAEPSGVLLLDKPQGPTSHDMIGRVRRLYSTRRVGHTGTLDPMATGLLVVLVGRAAKAAEYLTLDDKRYTARLTLGYTTDTEDATGRVLSESDAVPGEDEVQAACRAFTGRISQLPPMYSAIKIGGRKLCDLARAGETVERTPREVTIHSLTAERAGEREYILKVHCSKGTYIRTLCADLGRALGCGGVMSALRRTAVGGFSLTDALPPDRLEELDGEARAARLIPVSSLFSDLPTLVLPPFYERLCRCGAEIYQVKIGAAYGIGQRLRLSGSRGFFALGEVREYPGGSAVKAIKNFDVE